MSDEPRQSIEAGVRWTKLREDDMIVFIATIGKWSARVARSANRPGPPYTASISGGLMVMGYAGVPDLEQALEWCEREAARH